LSRSFADKLARLFDEVRGPGGRRWEHREVVEAINAAGQAKISASYLSELVSGKKDNPNFWTVKALADFFGQSVEYFVDDRPPTLDRPRTVQISSGPGTTTLAERLELLFKMARNPGDAEVASAVADSVPGFTAARLARLRTGTEADATGEEVDALASYFGVPAAVLTDAQVAELVAAQLPALALMGDDTVRRIAFRAHALTPRDQQFVSELLERLVGRDPGMSADELDF